MVKFHCVHGGFQTLPESSKGGQRIVSQESLFHFWTMALIIKKFLPVGMGLAVSST